MLGSNARGQSELLIVGSLWELIPDQHVVVRVDWVLDPLWLREAVRDRYAADGAGCPGIDPEVAVRLMVAGFLLGIVYDRRLLREAQVNLAIRWFVGYGLHERLPDYSSLTRIRQRWGAELFVQVFTRTVQACLKAGNRNRRGRAHRRYTDPGGRRLGEPGPAACRCRACSGRRR